MSLGLNRLCWFLIRINLLLKCLLLWSKLRVASLNSSCLITAIANRRHSIQIMHVRLLLAIYSVISIDCHLVTYVLPLWSHTLKVAMEILSVLNLDVITQISGGCSMHCLLHAWLGMWMSLILSLEGLMVKKLRLTRNYLNLRLSWRGGLDLNYRLSLRIEYKLQLLVLAWDLSSYNLRLITVLC